MNSGNAIQKPEIEGMRFFLTNKAEGRDKFMSQSQESQPKEENLL